MKIANTLGLALCLLGAATACRDSRVHGTGCEVDKDCGDPASAYRCETQTGVCYCRTNQACAPTEFCNTIGFCQDRAGCATNSDCLDPSLFCDTSTGTCLSKGRCSLDIQCDLGQVCDLATNRCIDGCRANGDCNGSSCRCGNGPCTCLAKTEAERKDCQVGVCDPAFCADNSFCRFGDQCGPVADGGLSQCYNDKDATYRPYCATCNYDPGSSNPCGKGPNFCLVDTQRGGEPYCGVDCSEGQSCPRGYACQDVVVVGGGALPSCGSNQACPTHQDLPCATDAECPRGGKCAKAAGAPNGYCQGQCLGAEGGAVAFCSCLVDTDCATETCTAGQCSITQRACVGDQDCRQIRCVDFNGVGGCLIGQNCAPASGLSCLEVQ